MLELKDPYLFVWLKALKIFYRIFENDSWIERTQLNPSEIFISRFRNTKGLRRKTAFMNTWT